MPAPPNGSFRPGLRARTPTTPGRPSGGPRSAPPGGASASARSSLRRAADVAAEQPLDWPLRPRDGPRLGLSVVDGRDRPRRPRRALLAAAPPRPASPPASTGRPRADAGSARRAAPQPSAAIAGACGRTRAAAARSVVAASTSPAGQRGQGAGHGPAAEPRLGSARRRRPRGRKADPPANSAVDGTTNRPGAGKRTAWSSSARRARSPRACSSAGALRRPRAPLRRLPVEVERISRDRRCIQ